MRFRWIAAILVLTLVAAGCGDDTSSTESGDGSPSDDGGSGDGDDGDGDGSADGDNEATGDDTDNDDGGIDNNATGDDDDFGDIIGDDDFDEDLLDDDTADMVDDIDDIVSVGDCVAETMAIGAIAPEDWFCTVLDNPIAGFDGFTLKSSTSDLEITIGSLSPIGPCDFEGICENVMPVELAGFDDAITFEQFGVASGVFGNSAEFGASLTVTKIGPMITDEDLQFVRDYVATLTSLA